MIIKYQKIMEIDQHKFQFVLSNQQCKIKKKKTNIIYNHIKQRKPANPPI